MWYFIIVIILTIIIGFLKQLYDANKFSNDYDKVKNYYDIFIDLSNQIISNKNFDNKLYSTLIKQSEEMQLLIGFYGFIDLEEQGRIYPNYPLVLNAMPKLKELITETNSFGITNICKELEMLQNGFLRYFNNIEVLLDKYRKNIFNPFICLREGIKLIVSFPINVLYWIGIISENNKNKIEKSFFVKALSIIGTLITILSTIMSIVVGWEEFIKIIKNIF